MSIKLMGYEVNSKVVVACVLWLMYMASNILITNYSDLKPLLSGNADYVLSHYVFPCAIFFLRIYKPSSTPLQKVVEDALGISNDKGEKDDDTNTTV